MFQRPDSAKIKGVGKQHPSYFKEKNPLLLVEEVYNMCRDQNTQRAQENKFEVISRAKGLKLTCRFFVNTAGRPQYSDEK